MPKHKHEWPTTKYRYRYGRSEPQPQKCRSCPVTRRWNWDNTWKYSYPKDWQDSLVTDEEVEMARSLTAEWVADADPDFVPPPPHRWRVECVHTLGVLPWELHASNGDNACFLEAFATQDEALAAAEGTVPIRPMRSIVVQ